MKNKKRITYAGFSYDVYFDAATERVVVEVVEGQHPAANKDKHKQVARELFVNGKSNEFE